MRTNFYFPITKLVSCPFPFDAKTVIKWRERMRFLKGKSEVLRPQRVRSRHRDTLVDNRCEKAEIDWPSTAIYEKISENNAVFSLLSKLFRCYLLIVGIPRGSSAVFLICVCVFAPILGANPWQMSFRYLLSWQHFRSPWILSYRNLRHRAKCDPFENFRRWSSASPQGESTHKR